MFSFDQVALICMFIFSYIQLLLPVHVLNFSKVYFSSSRADIFFRQSYWLCSHPTLETPSTVILAIFQHLSCSTPKKIHETHPRSSRLELPELLLGNLHGLQRLGNSFVPPCLRIIMLALGQRI